MKPLDRYLRAVRPLLPKAQRDDVVAELSEEIRTQIAEREGALGRSLSDEEQDAILGRYGHPMVVGGRYQPDQGSLRFGRELIGRELFPFYANALKITFAISFAAHLAIVAILSSSGLIAPGGVLGTFATHFVVQFAILTAFFAALQAQVTRNPRQWDARPATSAERPSSIRVGAVVEFALLAIALPWVYRMLGEPAASFGFAKLAPVWHEISGPILGAMVLTLVQAAWLAVRPEWVRLRSGVHVAALAVYLAASGYLLSAGERLIPLRADAARGVAALDRAVFFNGLIVVAISLVIALGIEMAGLKKAFGKALR